MPDFLLEIGTEEIPDWMIEPALLDLRRLFEASCGALGGSAIVTNATPRRLVLLCTGLSTQTPDDENIVAGPYLSAGAKAAEGFARKCATAVDRLTTIKDAKGERYIFQQLAHGRRASELLVEKLPGVIGSLPFPKAMAWPGSAGVRFIRPIRWIVALLADEVMPFEIAGVRSGNTTRGHRVLGAKTPIPVTISTFENILLQNGVILRAAERQKRIRDGLGPRVRVDEELLATLVYLTEFPSVIRGSFDPAFLELPKEILATVMRHHQRYFSVLNEDGSLTAEFVAVTNTDGDPDGLIRQGNQRVLRARFNDARFFWQADQRKTLVERVSDLAAVTFHAKLGSYEEKTRRVVSLCKELAVVAGANAEFVQRAALLAKCDLTTDMVKEFPELQGVVGGLYARSQGEEEAVSIAIYDHYKPTSMEDQIPRTCEGQLVSLADKLDTLRACFQIGLTPTGSKDPFALRRAAQGIVKILFEATLPIPLIDLVKDIEGLALFLRERIEFYLREVRGYGYDEVKAVLEAGISTLPDVEKRIEAIHSIRATGDFEAVAASFKRIQNILKQAQFTDQISVDTGQFTAEAERDLYDAFRKIRQNVAGTSNYRQKLDAMASLRPQVDCFFDKILVNDPDAAIRKNRLALLCTLLTEFANIADFSEIVTQGASGIVA